MNTYTFQHGDRAVDGYTIEGPLGHGGFGDVYHARSAGGKDVALKLVQRFMDVELRGVGHCLNLKHHNLVTIYDVKGDDDGRQWIIMEYVQGPTLADVLDEHPEGLPAPEAMRWFEGISAAVEHLHQAGIVHRDLKPGNVFDDRGTVKVGDYGLAKFITASKRSAQTQSVGTMHYMAPEVGGGRYGREVDVYAVGIMLYEMLTGKVPFDGETPAESLMKHLTASPNLEPLPPAFRGIVGRMLAKNPADRYGSLGAVLSDLKVRLVDAENSAGEPEQPPWPGYDSYASRPGVSGMMEAPFEFIQKLWKGLPDSPPAEEPVHMGETVRWSEDAPAVAPAPNRAAAPTWSTRAEAGLTTVGAVLVSLVAGLGSGLLVAGLSLWLFKDDETATLIGVGSGLGIAALVINRFLMFNPRSPVLRVFSSLFCGLGVGLLGGGVFIMLDGDDEIALFLGFGGGLVTAGIIGYRSIAPLHQWVFLRLFTALFTGLGAGLATAGMLLPMRIGGRWYEDIAGFCAGGVGCLTASFLLVSWLGSVPGYRWTRFFAALLCGLGVGLSAAGLSWLVTGDDNVVGFVGGGAGLLTFGFIAASLFAPRRHPQRLRR
ncbi:MAG: serine/threonine protein kinase [Planctomycetes bacterium]|nr:serine/threonine protein kinase [Planctomycetota bacterium]